MAELASVKVALLDIGKEQRMKKKKKNQTRHRMVPCAHAPSPALRKPASSSLSFLQAHDLLDAVSHLPFGHFFPSGRRRQSSSPSDVAPNPRLQQCVCPDK
jgi:hypothetical protein